MGRRGRRPLRPGRRLVPAPVGPLGRHPDLGRAGGLRRPMSPPRPRPCSGRRSAGAEAPPAPARCRARRSPAARAPSRALPAGRLRTVRRGGGWPRSASGSCTAPRKWPPGWRPAAAPAPAVVGLAPGPEVAIRPGGPAQPGPVRAGRGRDGDRGRRRDRPGGPARVDADELAACVSCGLCLPHCPTYRVVRRRGALAPRGASPPSAPSTRPARRSTPPSPGSCRPACNAGPASRPARRRSRSAG